MPIINIQPNDHFDFNVGGAGKYLLIRYADTGVFLASDSFRPSGIQTGDAINVTEFDAVRFENESVSVAKVEYQISDLPVQTNATQNITIQRIIEPIQFEASVKVVDGLKVELIAPNQLVSAQDKTIAPGQTAKVTSNALGRKQTAIQVISDEATTLRIGGANVAENVGALLRGSISAVASMVIESGAEVYVFNGSNTTATVSVTEVIA
ncbi:hypothetical protein [Vibrio vulnificus]|uniref:hypothetical protein n=1 Tax=Vibrio vulnificus TaxID=672 RepID=UPI0005FBDE44|nr:hypothetical protein [Vibrio vulnificus]